MAKAKRKETTSIDHEETEPNNYDITRIPPVMVTPGKELHETTNVVDTGDQNSTTLKKNENNLDDSISDDDDNTSLDKTGNKKQNTTNQMASEVTPEKHMMPDTRKILVSKDKHGNAGKPKITSLEKPQPTQPTHGKKKNTTKFKDKHSNVKLTNPKTILKSTKK